MKENIKRKDAEQLIRQFFPVIDYFEEKQFAYCVVGGIAVLIHCYINDSKDYRETMDADFIIPEIYSNKAITEDYLSVFSKNEDEREKLKMIILGDELKLSDLSSSYENISIEGAVKKIDGFNTPNVDICRKLNDVSIDSIDKEHISILGHNIWVATITQLIKMKENVIDLYGSDPVNSPRFHDRIDVKLLKNILGE